MDVNVLGLQEGTLLQQGKYKIVRFIDNGGFGCTYEALHVKLGRVAIKEFFPRQFCIRDSAAMSLVVSNEDCKPLVKKLKGKFLDEARALFSMRNDGIVRIIDVFEENQTAYYAMEFIDGSSLAEIVKDEGPLKEPRTLKYIRQVCKALQYVHSRHRLHLDIKPANIMINGSDNAVLIDFGSSRQYEEEGGKDTSMMMPASVGYAPPEQMSSSVVKFEATADIYSVGATLYKLLTGVTPPASNLLASGTRLEPLPNSVSKATRKAVEAAMQIKKDDRPQTVEEFIKVLDGGDPSRPDDEPTEIDGQGKEEKEEKKKVPRKGVGCLITALVALVLLIVMTVFLWTYRQRIYYNLLYWWNRLNRTTVVQPPIRGGGDGQPSDSDSIIIPHGPGDEPEPQVVNAKLDLGYGVWEGEVEAGKPHGIGTLTYTQSHRLSEGGFDETVAQVGDYVCGEFEDGKFIWGTLYDSNGNKKKTIAQ